MPRSLGTFRARRRDLTKLQSLSKKAFGFSETITYQDILFNVSPELVIADLSPLAFLNLVERIDSDGEEAAAVRLYERLLPLLSCRHRWIEPTMPLDQPRDLIMYEPLQGFGRVSVCELCTAYAISTPGAHLPAVGRSVD
ncbi:hypothetical protein HDF16_004089 [Granulicella aggregans]|uniref:Uncharacterized protein n=1 Tax=Granulicella aggregans TaxID=474949 RepID=A0A7W7ZHH6_9BACT|nr:hypothetical protein [Granulicella aggregans]MBB5059366.1 hypothetical protein [Granulicella aggregans]